MDPIDRRASTVRGAGSASTVRGAGSASTARGASKEPGIFHAAIRAVSGHTYPFLRIERFCVPLTHRDLPSLSALVHVTRPYRLTNIMKGGIRPGAQQPTGGRPHVYMSAFMPDDPRLVSGKRTGASREVAIVIDPKRLLDANVALWLTPNGTVLTSEVVSPMTFYSIIEYDTRHEQLKTCVFHASLLHLPIVGFRGGRPEC